jgi:Amt family ammonium transporter
MILNGALGGLVSVTAGADVFDMYTPIYVGAIGGAIVVFGVAFFDRLRLDDPVGALSVHLLNGIWATIAVAIFSDASLWDQAKGVLVVGVFAFTSSFVVMYIINKVSPFRAKDDEQQQGLDIEECGLEAYPEFKRSI